MLFRSERDASRLANLLAAHGLGRGDRLAILTNGGGIGVLAVDRLVELGGIPAGISHATSARLDAVLPPTWSHANPVDIVGDADPARYAAALEALAEVHAVRPPASLRSRILAEATPGLFWLAVLFSTLLAIQRGGAAAPRDRNPTLSWEAETVCLTAMEPDLSRRYARAADLAHDLGN